MGSPTDGQQAQRERENMVKRERCNVVGFADIPNFLEGWCEPRFSLQNGRYDIAVREHSTF